MTAPNIFSRLPPWLAPAALGAVLATVVLVAVRDAKPPTPGADHAQDLAPVSPCYGPHPHPRCPPSGEAAAPPKPKASVDMPAPPAPAVQAAEKPLADAPPRPEPSVVAHKEAGVPPGQGGAAPVPAPSFREEAAKPPAGHAPVAGASHGARPRDFARSELGLCPATQERPLTLWPRAAPVHHLRGRVPAR